ncbi:MAG TPA: bifunctional hydroxymethylpyrimidine kinase/phosphomethylpyrimidine kinase [Gemmatimonadota bacterium]|nr:bifunctional hydroxymethylpyrimidine kinase/phosphomethylpyrimidine kinase [Gemmatimonadota bacterium]
MAVDAPAGDVNGDPSVRPIALTIAGSDSGGGAGIQADLKTFHAFEVFGTSVVTAITAQNTRAVTAVQRVDPHIVRAQMDALAADLPPAASKSGMLADAEIIETVAAGLEAGGFGPYVLDPVMVAASGARLLDPDAVGALRARLVPLARLVTPNLAEAAILADRPVNDPDEMRAAGERILELGCEAVLVKGGHLAGPTVVDILLTNAGERVWRAPKLDAGDPHGTGCTLSAAIAAGLAYGRPLEAAVDEALAFTRRAISTAPKRGAGSRPLNHWAKR